MKSRSQSPGSLEHLNLLGRFGAHGKALKPAKVAPFNQPNQDFRVLKIAINGCGVAGSTLAWWLKKYGHDPVLFEKASTLRKGGYVIDFWGTGYDVADRMGIVPTLKKDAYFIKHVKAVTSHGWTTSNMSTKAFHDLTEGRYMSIARSDLARHVFEACRAVETRFGTSVIGIADAKDRVSVNLSDGGEEVYDLVVGADGLHSKIRELTFGPQVQFEKHIGFYVAAFVLSGYRPRDELTYISHTRPERQISRVSLRNDQTLFLFVFSGDRLDREPVDEADKKTILMETYKGMGWETDAILSGMSDARDIYFDRVSQIRMQGWTRGRVALVGDAAACASLLAGEGTGLAMTEAYLLAGELHNASGNHLAAFKAYHDRLYSYVTAKQDGALGFANLFAPKSWFWLVVRDIAMNLTSVPLLGKRLLSGSLRADLDLPNYEANARVGSLGVAPP